MKKQLLKHLIFTTMFLLGFVTTWQSANAQCGTANTFVPTINNATVCSGNAVTISAQGLPVKKWVYRDNSSGSWLVNNTASPTLTDYPNVSVVTTRTYRAVVGTATCPTDSTQGVNVIISPLTYSVNNAILISASASTVCSGNTVNLNLLSVNGTVQSWIYKNNSTGSWVNFSSNTETTSDYNTSVSSLTTRTYRALVKISNTCEIDSSAPLNVTITPLIYGNNNAVKPNGNIPAACGGTAISLSVDWSASFIQNWIYRDNNTGTWNYLSGSSTNVTDNNTNISTATSRAYRVILKNNNSCNIDTSDAYYVSLTPSTKRVLNTIVPQYTGSSTICAGSSISVSLSGYSSSNVLAWIYRDSSNGNWITQSSGTNSLSFSTSSTISQNIVREIRAVINNAATTCTIDTSAAVFVNIKPQTKGNTTTFMPLVSNGTICSGAQLQVYMNTTSVSVSAWLYRNNNTGNWIYASSGTTYYDNNTTVATNTTRTYRAIVTSTANCSADTSNEVSTFIKMPVFGSTNGLKPTVTANGFCAGNTPTGSIIINSQQGIYKWIYRDNNTGTWSELLYNTSTYFYDYYTSTITIPTIRSYRALVRNNETCTIDTSNEVSTNINPLTRGNLNTVAPVAAFPYVCSGSSVSLNMVLPTGYSVSNWIYRDTTIGSWNYLSGSTTATDYNTTVTYNKIRYYRVILQNSTNCRYDTTGTITVNLNAKTLGNSGISPTTSNPSICSGSSQINVQISIPSGASVKKWIFRDNNIGNWTDVPNSSASTNYTDQQTNTGVLISTVRAYRSIIDNSNSCSADTSQIITSTISPVTGGTTTSIVPVLSGGSTVCNGASPYLYINYSGTVQKWIYSDNGGNWYDNNTTSTYLYENNLRVSVPTTRSYKAVIYRQGACLVDTTQSSTLNIYPYIFGNATNPTPTTSAASICSGGTSTLSCSISSPQTIQKWIYRDNNIGPWLDFTATTSSSTLYDYNTVVTSTINRNYRAIINQSTCHYDTTSIVNVTFNSPVNGYQLSVTPTSSTPILCSGSTAIVSVSGYSGGIKKWIYRDNNGIWYDVPSGTSSSISHTYTNVNAVTIRSYRALFSSNTCSIDSSAIYNITINPVGAGNASIIPTAGATNICASTSNPLVLSVSTGTSYTVKKWIQSENGGAWSDFGFATNSSTVYEYSTAVSLSVIRGYRVLLTNNTTCSIDTSAQVSVNFNALMRGNLTAVNPTTTRNNFCYGIPVSMSTTIPSNYTVQKWIFRNNSGVWKEFEGTTTSSSQTDYNTYVGITTARSYRVIMSNSTTCSADTTATLNVLLNARSSSVNNSTTVANTSTPSICSGNNASLSITPPGANTVYKWIYSNSGLAGPWYDVLSTSVNVTSLTHTNTSVQTSTSRLYRAILTDTSTCDYDSSLTVNVSINPMINGNDTSITITTASDTVCTASSVTLNTTVGSGVSIIKWIYRDNNNGPWLDFSSSSGYAPYTDNNTNVGGLNSRSYRVIELKNTTCSNDTSKAKTIFFKLKTNGTSLIVPYAGSSGIVDTICTGNSVSLYVSGTVDAWIYKDGNGSWNVIPSSASSSITHTNTYVATTTWRYYRAMLNTGSCRSDSSVIDSVLLRNMTRGNNNAVVPTTTTTSICSGSNPYLSITTPSGSTVQKWMYRDNNTGNWLDMFIGTATGLNDMNTTVSFVTSRAYRVIYLKSCSYDTSGALTVTISPRLFSNNNSLTPTAASTTVCAGTAVSNISVVAGSGNTILKWMYRDNNIGTWIDLVNGNSNNISDYNTYVGVAVNRSYRVIIINNTTCTNDTSAALNVTINPIVVGSISTTTPTASPSNSICSGTALTINVTPGSGNSVVRWTYNTNAGAWSDWGYNTSSSITDYNTYVSSSTTKGYRALIYQSATCRIDTSLALSVSVNPRIFGNDNTIIPSSGSSTVCYGSSTSISVVPGTGNSVSKWIYRDNNTGAWLDMTGGTTSFTDYSYVSSLTTRTYRALIIKGSVCTIDTSAAMSITLSPLIYGNDNTIVPVSTVSVCTGSSVTISIVPGSGNAVSAWMYRDNYTGSWNIFSYSTSTSITDNYTSVSSSTNRVYRALIRKGITCSIDSSSVDTTVISPRVWGNDNTIIPTTTGASSICTGTTIGLSVTAGSGNSVLKWIYKNNAGAWTDFYVGNYTSLTDYNTTVASTTVRSYRAIITKGLSCTNDTSATVTVTINPRSNGNDNTITPTSTSTSYCSASYVGVSVTPGSGNSLSKWIYRDNNIGVWLDWNVGTSTSVTDYYTTVSTITTRSYRAIIAKGSACNLDTSAALNVTLNPIGFGNQNTIAPIASNGNVCSGNPASLNVSGYTGTSVLRWLYRDNLTGAWNVIASGSNYLTDYNTTVSSTTVRSYRAMINNSANCSTDTTGIVNVTLNPITNGNNATAAQTSQATFCSGNAVNVFINTPINYAINSWLYRDNGGVWNVMSITSSASVYDYNTTVASTLSRSYRAILRNTAGCNIDSSAIVTITINTIGAGNNNALIPSTGTPSVCSGNTAVVSLTGFSGTVIKWLYRDSIINSWTTYSSTSTTIYDNNTYVSYNRTRSYRLIVYNPVNCSYDTTAAVQVQLNQLLTGNAPSVTPSSATSNYCSGNSISLNVTGLINGGAVTGWIYKDNSGAWTLISGSGGSTYNHSSTIVTSITSRGYRALVLTGCLTDTTSAYNVTIDVYPAKPLITQVTGKDTLISSVTGTTYTWKLNGSAISANTQRIFAPSSGNYTVEVGNATGCKTISDAFNFAKTGIEETPLQLFTSIYPNPTVSGIVNVSLQQINASKASVKVFDMLGKLVHEQDADVSNGKAIIEVDLSGNNTGIYFITVTAGQDYITRKVIFNKQ